MVKRAPFRKNIDDYFHVPSEFQASVCRIPLNYQKTPLFELFQRNNGVEKIFFCLHLLLQLSNWRLFVSSEKEQLSGVYEWLRASCCAVNVEASIQNCFWLHF
jgi:hypothetical protein